MNSLFTLPSILSLSLSTTFSSFFLLSHSSKKIARKQRACESNCWYKTKQELDRGNVLKNFYSSRGRLRIRYHKAVKVDGKVAVETAAATEDEIDVTGGRKRRESREEQSLMIGARPLSGVRSLNRSPRA